MRNNDWSAKFSLLFWGGTASLNAINLHDVAAVAHLCHREHIVFVSTRYIGFVRAGITLAEIAPLKTNKKRSTSSWHKVVVYDRRREEDPRVRIDMTTDRGIPGKSLITITASASPIHSSFNSPVSMFDSVPENTSI
ncbi:hypothetical protein DEU56DRAFT_839159 [Suillus clintonianus]|uniref:uncharacterized protein n=1 Tax=Suillus clintonianus TaxID=1904413 RepID=UPI001B882C18|nr:uncharacterized protein DEU56DRAFT_839159 [Suillus clintonianus]KAG2117598.1 hypothetical protein DEU56DRAFT_839159 [Suillus clintonianus]